jgi:hypothetical protein
MPPYHIITGILAFIASNNVTVSRQASTKQPARMADQAAAEPSAMRFRQRATARMAEASKSLPPEAEHAAQEDRCDRVLQDIHGGSYKALVRVHLSDCTVVSSYKVELLLDNSIADIRKLIAEKANVATSALRLSFPPPRYEMESGYWWPDLPVPIKKKQESDDKVSETKSPTVEPYAWEGNATLKALGMEKMLIRGKAVILAWLSPPRMCTPSIFSGKITTFALPLRPEGSWDQRMEPRYGVANVDSLVASALSILRVLSRRRRGSPPSNIVRAVLSLLVEPKSFGAWQAKAKLAGYHTLDLDCRRCSCKFRCWFHKDDHTIDVKLAVARAHMLLDVIYLPEASPCDERNAGKGFGLQRNAQCLFNSKISQNSYCIAVDRNGKVAGEDGDVNALKTIKWHQVLRKFLKFYRGVWVREVWDNDQGMCWWANEIRTGGDKQDGGSFSLL